MKEKMEPKLEKKEYGKNIVQRDIYYRHGEKTSGGELAPKGFKQAEEIGKSLKVAKAGIKPYFSEFKRAEDFAKATTEATKTKKKFVARQRFGLGKKEYWPPELMKKVKTVITEKGEEAGFQYYLDFGDKKPTPDSLSPKEVAAKFAKQVLTHVKMTDRYYNGSEVDLINGTHGFAIEPFLKEAISDQVEKNPVNLRGKTFLEKMGGKFKTAENFEVLTKIDEKGEKTIKLLLRDKEYDLNPEKLENLIKECKEE